MITDKITVYWNNHKLESEGYIAYCNDATVCADWKVFFDSHDDSVGMESIVERVNGTFIEYDREGIDKLFAEREAEAQLEREHIKLEKMV